MRDLVTHAVRANTCTRVRWCLTPSNLVARCSPANWRGKSTRWPRSSHATPSRCRRCCWLVVPTLTQTSHGVSKAAPSLWARQDVCMTSCTALMARPQRIVRSWSWMRRIRCWTWASSRPSTTSCSCFPNSAAQGCSPQPRSEIRVVVLGSMCLALTRVFRACRRAR